MVQKAKISTGGNPAQPIRNTVADKDLNDAFDVLNHLVPVGSIMATFCEDEPKGWLFCDGRVLFKHEYPRLYNALRGAVDETDVCFNLPDLRGRVLVGRDNMGDVSASRVTVAGSGIDANNVGETGGSETHTLTVAEMPAHTHTYHEYTALTATAGGLSMRGGSSSNVNTSSTGGDGAHNNMPPVIVVNWMIRY